MNKPTTTDPKEVIRHIASIYGVTTSLTSSKRDEYVVNVRAIVAQVLLRGPWSLNYTKIGDLINRNHSTVIDLCKRRLPKDFIVPPEFSPYVYTGYPHSVKVKKPKKR